MLRASISRITTVVCRVTGQRYDEVSQVVHFSNKGVPRLHLANSCVLILILPTFSEYLAVFLKGQDT